MRMLYAVVSRDGRCPRGHVCRMCCQRHGHVRRDVARAALREKELLIVPSRLRHGSRFGSGAIHGTVLQSRTRVITASWDECNIVGKQGVLMTLLPAMIRCVPRYSCERSRDHAISAGMTLARLVFSDIRKYSQDTQFCTECSPCVCHKLHARRITLVLPMVLRKLDYAHIEMADSMN